MAQDNGKALLSAEARQPSPGEDTFEADHESLSIGRNCLKERFRRCLHIPVQYDLTGLIQETERHGSCVQVEATIKLVLLGVTSPEVSSSLEW
jgi:hypothetical protein